MPNSDGKATPAEIRAFFECDSRETVGAKELIALKKDADGNPSSDYDDIAFGIGNGSLTY